MFYVTIFLVNTVNNVNMGNIIVGILMIVGGFFIVAKSEWIVRNLGRTAFIEQKLGYGSSNFIYKLAGIVIIILGTFVLVGLWQEGFIGVFGRFFTGLKIER